MRQYNFIKKFVSVLKEAFSSPNGLATDKLLPYLNRKEVNNLDLDSDTLPVERALGVRWCAQSDSFKFKITLSDRPLTRRRVLSTISFIYDPLGVLVPVVLSAKRILQNLC